MSNTAHKPASPAALAEGTSLLYLECSSGISGDMAVAALLDLGANRQAVEQALSSLPVQGFTPVISRVRKSGLDVCDFDVQLDAAHENHDHDMAYLHGPAPTLRHGSGPHTHGHHEHRGLKEVEDLIEAAEMSTGAKEVARRVFRILAEAEAQAHGLPVEEVHFHEVGAIDSIADIVAFAVAFDSLSLSDVVVTELCEGQGSIRCQHGLIPIPAPAVVNIATAYGLPLHVLPISGELVTPTGAAFVAAIRTQDVLPQKFVIERVGMGNGKREYETPGILRAMRIRIPVESSTA